MRGQHKAVVVGVRHDQRTHQACRHAPRRGPHIFKFIVAVDEFHIKCLGKILSEEVRRTRLQCLAVLHHCLDGIRLESTGKAFIGRFHTFHHRHGHVAFGKVGIHVEHTHGFFHCFLLGGMSCVPLLPQEFGSTQEHACAHFPTEHICPLVTQYGKIAIRLYPVTVSVPYNSLGRGAYYQFLFKAGIGVNHHAAPFGVVLEAVMRDHGTLLCKALHMVGLLAKERLWYQQREISIDVSCVLEHLVKYMLHLFPYCIAIRLYHHATPHCRLLGKVGFYYQFIIPLRIIFSSLG